MNLKVRYDPEQDILYLAQEGWEEEYVEIHPGVNLELDKNGDPIGVEIMRASQLLKPVMASLTEKSASLSD